MCPSAHVDEQRSRLREFAQHRCAPSLIIQQGRRAGTLAPSIGANFHFVQPLSPDLVRALVTEVEVSTVRSITAQISAKGWGQGHRKVKSLFELLGKAMQSTGTTLRLCLLMLVAAAAYVISQLK
jgi:hypothetical protein